MARRPNYAFERSARAKAKADKREVKRQAKLAAKASERPGTIETAPSAEDVADEPSTEQTQSGQADST